MDVVRAGKMKIRKRANSFKHKRKFSKTARAVRVENMSPNPMRGGIRL